MVALCFALPAEPVSRADFLRGAGLWTAGQQLYPKLRGQSRRRGCPPPQAEERPVMSLKMKEIFSSRFF